MYAPVFMKHIIKNDNTEAVLHVNLLVWTDGVALFPATETKDGCWEWHKNFVSVQVLS